MTVTLRQLHISHKDHRPCTFLSPLLKEECDFRTEEEPHKQRPKDRNVIKLTAGKREAFPMVEEPHQ